MRSCSATPSAPPTNGGPSRSSSSPTSTSRRSWRPDDLEACFADDAFIAHAPDIIARLDALEAELLARTAPAIEASPETVDVAG